MATLVTGGCGFIGLSIAERLIATGEQVVLFDRNPAAPDLLARPELAGAALITGDVRNAADIDRALDMDIDHIIHTAAVTPNQQREHDQAREIIDINVLGTVNVMERASQRASILRVTSLSSVAVYGFSAPRPSGMLEEDISPPAPAALYGITKLAAEQTALRMGHLHDMDIRIVRLGPVFGPWEIQTGVRDALSPHYQILQAALAGQLISLSRVMTGDWVYSRDAADGIVKVSQTAKLNHNIYHVGGRDLTDLAQWCKIVAHAVPGFRWERIGEDQPGSVIYGLPKDRAPLSIARLAADTGYQPAFDLNAAASDYLNWLGHGEHH
jgi:UDP-glucose 4-epimerase/UDP-glucuronate 4-epimerase